MTDKKKKASGQTYAEASDELEQILQEIESGEIDLDELSAKVERAATLLTFCRQQLAATETKVKKVTAELAAAIADEAAAADDDDDDDQDEES